MEKDTIALFLYWDCMRINLQNYLVFCSKIYLITKENFYKSSQLKTDNNILLLSMILFLY